METYKITRYISTLLFTSSLIANNQHISIDDAINRFKQYNLELRHVQERSLLNEEKSVVLSHYYYPTLKPLNFQYDPKLKTGTMQGDIDMKLPTGGALKFNLTQPVNSDGEQKYYVHFDQPITRNTGPLIEEIKRLELAISQLKAQDSYNVKILSLKKQYKQCMQEQLILAHKKTTFEILKQQIKSYDIKYKYGEISKIEYTKQIANIEKQAIEISRLEESCELSLIKLKQQLGLQLTDSIELDDDLTFIDISINPAEAMALVAKNNIHLKINHINKRINTLKHQTNQRKSLPDVSFYGQINQDNETSFGLKMKYQVYDSETAYQDVEEVLNFTQAAERYDAEENEARLKLHELLLSLKHEKTLISLSAENLKNQQLIHQAESIKFKYNEISAEEFQDASQNLQNAYNETINAQIKYSNLYDDYLLMTGQINQLNQANRDGQ